MTPTPEYKRRQALAWRIYGVSSGAVVWQTNGTLTRAVELTPLLIDYDDFHPRPPKSGKNVGYMDGHAAGLDSSPTP